MTIWIQSGIVMVTLALSGAVGFWLTQTVLTLADRSNARQTGDSQVAAPQGLRGGTWIGVLERLAVTGTLLAGEPGGVAIVVAIKGLGRYPELRSNDRPGIAERFVIGTLASLLWAGVLGILGRWLITR